MMNYEKEVRPKYNIEDFRTWDNYDSDIKKLVSIEDEYCINCQEFHVLDEDGKCPNCRTPMKTTILPRTQDNLKDMGVDYKEVDGNKIDGYDNNEVESYEE